MERWTIYYLKFDGSIGKAVHEGDVYSFGNIILDGSLGGGQQAIIRIEKIASTAD